MDENNKKYPEGHFVGIWMAIGVAVCAALGVPLMIVTKNPGMIAIGPGLGVSFGLAIGSAIEAKHKKEGRIRPLTEEEKKRRKIGIIVSLVILVVLFLLGLLTFLSRT
jgi:hypothetical protein